MDIECRVSVGEREELISEAKRHQAGRRLNPRQRVRWRKVGETPAKFFGI